MYTHVYMCIHVYMCMHARDSRDVVQIVRSYVGGRGGGIYNEIKITYVVPSNRSARRGSSRGGLYQDTLYMIILKCIHYCISAAYNIRGGLYGGGYIAHIIISNAQNIVDHLLGPAGLARRSKPRGGLYMAYTTILKYASYNIACRLPGPAG